MSTPAVQKAMAADNIKPKVHIFHQMSTLMNSENDVFKKVQDFGLKHHLELSCCRKSSPDVRDIKLIHFQQRVSVN